MAWTTPITFVINILYQVSVWNQQLRDNMRYLKGLDGPVTTENNLTVQGDLAVDGTLSIAGVIGSYVSSDFQRFTSSGTWTKPTAVTWVLAQIIGAGGGGTAFTGNRAGGGAGEVVWVIFRASDLGDTETVTVGAGATGGDSSTHWAPSISSTLANRGGYSEFNGVRARGGVNAVNFSSQEVMILLATRPGQGGSSRTNFFPGTPGLGASSWTASGTNGADSDWGTGSGGGGIATGTAGNGGAPGGGGGSVNDSAGTQGSGARGEVRVWAW